MDGKGADASLRLRCQTADSRFPCHEAARPPQTMLNGIATNVKMTNWKAIRNPIRLAGLSNQYANVCRKPGKRCPISKRTINVTTMRRASERRRTKVHATEEMSTHQAT